MVQFFDGGRRERTGGAGPGGGAATGRGGPSGGPAAVHGMQRVPPHNIDAERSLLGAMLLSKDAIAAAMETTSADDFYRPAHAHVFEAIQSLYGQDQSVDPVTVADELARAGVLDTVGGLPALVSLQAETPAITSASRYARIVEEHALLRRLIAVAGEIAEMGYSVPDDVTAAIDRAESMVFDVAERRVTDSLKDLTQLLFDSMDRLERLFERGETITGVPTGYVDLDERLYGLQPNALYIVGARPAMGKCVAWDTRVVDPSTGALETIESLHRRGVPPCVLSLGEDRRLRPAAVSAMVDDGVRPVFRVTTRLGRTIRTTASHPFLTPEGWRPLASLSVGESVAVARVVPTREAVQMDPAEVALLAYVAGAGSCRGATTVRTTSAASGEDLHRCVEAVGGVLTGGSAGVYAVVGRDGGDPVRELLSRHGLLGRGESEMCVPAALFSCAPALVALFANRIFSLGLGGGSGNGGPPRFSAPSRRLALDVAHLLLRLGVVTAVRLRLVDRRGMRRPEWSVEPVTTSDELSFARRVGCGLNRPADALVSSSVGALPGAGAAEAVGAGGGHPARPETDVFFDEVVAIVSDGEDRVYDLTVPGTHNFVADDFIVHNTAFALGMALHAAVEARVPTLLFSLEMGAEEITNRLLVSEARVDAGRMRNGKLTEPDWPKISQAVARLGDAPLYIDDNPNVTVMEIRAKARRLKARKGDLGLIIVDYLQLMSGNASVENRQLEVSSISRGLKILARELEVPVVALSQLSRQLETRSDKRPILADLRESGCMPASTRLLRADNGQEVTLGALVLSQEQPLVWSLDETTWKMVPRRVTNAFPSGIKPVFRLRLRSGYEVQATADHKFRTIDGWRRLDEIPVGEAIATPRTIPAPVGQAEQGSDEWSDEELVLLAHLLGDGSIGPSGVKYATADPANKAVVEATARALFGIEVAGSRQGNTWLLWFPAPYRLRHGRVHPVRNWLEPHGLWGTRSHTKFVPEGILGLEPRRIALFLRHLWSTDGSITLSRNGKGPVVRTYYATTSRRLAEGVRRALLRLSIRSQMSPVRKAGYDECWHVTITGAPDQEAFLRTVGCHGARGDVVPQVLTALAATKPNPNVDLVPYPVADLVSGALRESGVTHRQLAQHLGERYCGSYPLGSESRPRRFSPRRLEAIGQITGSPQLEALATSDVMWDEVVEVTPVGAQPTFDATVEGTHNFVANGVIAHNSLEQDADVVMFLYRDEMYNPESTDRGTAEVIVAKHRNGPTGKIQLAFLDHYTKFANMARV